MPGNKKDIISSLQKNILLWEGFKPRRADDRDSCGLGPVEAAFPNGVFPVGAIHELLCPTPEQAAATSGFIAGILSALMKQEGICLWVSTSRKLFPSALPIFNIEPHRMIFIDLKRERDVLWVTEEALKCEGLAAVITELQDISFSQSRRLQLAVENSKVTGFILRKDLRKAITSTCAARWQITSIPSEPDEELPGVGFPRWQVELIKVRNGNPGTWKVEWADGNFVPIDEKTVPNQIFQISAV